MQQRAPGEDLDMASFVGDLRCQQLHDLTKVRVEPAKHSGGQQQRRLLVLDEIGHRLHDGGLEVVRCRVGCGPVDRGRRIPLIRRRIRHRAAEQCPPTPRHDRPSRPAGSARRPRPERRAPPAPIAGRRAHSRDRPHRRARRPATAATSRCPSRSWSRHRRTRPGDLASGTTHRDVAQAPDGSLAPQPDFLAQPLSAPVARAGDRRCPDRAGQGR